MHYRVNVLMFLIYVQKGQIENKSEFGHYFFFSCLQLHLHLFFSKKTISLKIITTIFFCCGPLPFLTQAPLLPHPTQNLLNYVSG